ncbi:MAG: tetratricopeptide repeat protein [Blastocatellia bacterium]|nr:tetratricopeptide repeat protein [Blastocatellia bacterium]
MKRCPECGREYDNTMMFCLDDGAELLYGPASMDEPTTAILHSTAAQGEAPTRAQIQMTDQTAILPANTGDIVPQPRGFDKRLLFAPLALAVIVLGGFFGYRYFTPANQINSIAVMPFVNESGNPDTEFLSDGMTETLINSLSQIANLSVKARSSVFRYKGKEIDPKKVASELGVQAILTGRVVQRGDQLTLSVELIDGLTENTIWGNKYERKGSDLVALQSEVARDVSAKLKSKLTGADSAKVEKTYTANPEAYQLYLKGRFAWNKRTGPAIKQAADFFRQAIEKDPNYALAYSGLAETYVIFSSYTVATAKDSMPKAKAAALRALELDDSLAAAHTALAEYLVHYEFDRVGAEKEFRRAIKLNPNYPTAHQWLGNLLASVKRFDEALVELKRAEELDPLSSIIALNVGDTLVADRRYDEGIAVYKRLLSADPDFALAHFALGEVYGLKGMYPEALNETRRAFDLDPDPSTKGYIGLWLALSGDRDGAKKMLEEMKQDSTGRYVQSFSFGMIHIGLGEKEKALDWIEKEVEERGSATRYFATAGELDDLRTEPRFRAMLKQLNLPE